MHHHILDQCSKAVISFEGEALYPPEVPLDDLRILIDEDLPEKLDYLVLEEGASHLDVTILKDAISEASDLVYISGSQLIIFLKTISCHFEVILVAEPNRKGEADQE